MRKLALPGGLALLLLLPLAAAGAANWECRNDVEVTCAGGACKAVATPGAFTPMDVSFDARGRFSVCAYVGCWTGRGRVTSTGPFRVIAKARASWNDPGHDRPEDVLIAFREQDGIASVMVGGFVTPLHCSARAGHP